MNFVMTYQISASDWHAAVRRFLETQAPPPAGVEMLGRWHSAAGRHGFILLKSDDQSAVYRWAAEWGDLCDLAVTPVLNDEEAAAVLSSMK